MTSNTIKESNISTSNTSFSSDLLDSFKKKMGELSQRYPTVDLYIKENYGINNIMDVEFPDLSNASEENIIFERVRGNHRLMTKAVITQDEANKIIDNAINAKFKL